MAALIFENLCEGAFVVGPDCRITAFNPAAERISGFSSREAIGRRCFEVLHHDICDMCCALRARAEDGEARGRVRIPIVTRDGRTVPLSVTSAVLRDDRGVAIGGVELFRDRSEQEALERRLRQVAGIGRMVSANAEMQRILALLPDVAASDCAVLISGPGGSGKAWIAHALHELGTRREGPYARLNCCAFPKVLLESELFGCQAGARPGVERAKVGQLDAAHGGTLLLDEVGELPLDLQTGLLELLSRGGFRPIGSVDERKADVRIIASTSRPLDAAVASGSFREDLYFRLNVVHIELPPLRERLEDVPLLVDQFIARFREECGGDVRGITSEALHALRCYDFPGNVRELESVIEHAFVMCRGDTIEIDDLPSRVLDADADPMGSRHATTAERTLICEALERNAGNRSRTAAELGMHRTTLWRKLRQYGLA